jgi:type II secretory pathway component PulC
MTSLAQMVQLRLAGMTGSPRQFVSSRLAAMLGRAELPGRSELAALRPATRVLIISFAAVIGLAAVATFSAVISLELSTVTAPTWLGRSSPAAKASGARASAGFENILQRPLFSRNRQVFVAAEPVSAPPPTAATLDSGITLKGVFISDGVAKAFLMTSQNPVGVWVQVNEQIDGWRIAAVTPEQVVLEGQGEKLTVPLHASGR